MYLSYFHHWWQKPQATVPQSKSFILKILSPIEYIVSNQIVPSALKTYCHEENLIINFVTLSAKYSVWSNILPALLIVPIKFMQSLSWHSLMFIVGWAAADYTLVC